MRVAVEGNDLKAVYSCTTPDGASTSAAVSGFFIVYSTRNRLAVGDPYGRARG
jgi:hypothetical protein